MRDKKQAAAGLDNQSRRPREHALAVASNLFYAHGARAVGMEQIVEISGVAKTTIYRHFPTKDALIQAFLEKEDGEFWEQWDTVVGGEVRGFTRLDALCRWIGERVLRDNYRGCPQLNLAAEFADPTHLARAVARRHKAEMHRRLELICRECGVASSAETAMQIALLFDGAFTSDGRLATFDPSLLLSRAVRSLMLQI